MKKLFGRRWFKDIDNRPNRPCGFEPWTEYDNGFALFRVPSYEFPKRQRCFVYYRKDFSTFMHLERYHTFEIGQVIRVCGKWVAMPYFGDCTEAFVDSEQDGVNLIQALFLMDGRSL